MSDDLGDFKRFMQQREAAARDYVCGDATTLAALTAHSGEATFFGPKGGAISGAREVLSSYERDAAIFQPRSETHFEILQLGASQGLGYWVGFQHATVQIKGQAEPIPMKLRVSEVFRREGQAWKLVHRHADAQASEGEHRAPPR